MICLFDCHELHRFSFNEECQIGQIESNQVLKDVKIASNGLAAWAGEGQIIVINQCGYSERYSIEQGEEEGLTENIHERLSEWSTESNKLFNNIGPVVDFIQNGDSTLCVAGLSPYSGFYEIKQGIQHQGLTRLDLDIKIDEVWFLTQNTSTLALIKFLDTELNSVLLKLNENFSQHELVVSDLDMTSQTISLREKDKLMYQLVDTTSLTRILLILDSESLKLL